MAPRRLKKAQRLPLRNPNMAPRWPQDGPKRPQDGPKKAPQAPKMPQDGPKTAQRCCKMAPRRAFGGSLPGDPPKDLLEASKAFRGFPGRDRPKDF